MSRLHSSKVDSSLTRAVCSKQLLADLVLRMCTKSDLYLPSRYFSSSVPLIRTQSLEMSTESASSSNQSGANSECWINSSANVLISRMSLTYCIRLRYHLTSSFPAPVLHLQKAH